MKYFNVPADFKKETIDEYARLNDEYEDSKVIETYGNVTLGLNYGSGRVFSQLPLVDLATLKDYIEYSKQKNINFNYTFNTPFLQNREFTREGVLEINSFLRDLYDAGVRFITIAMPSLIKLVKYLNYDFEIKASAVCHITTANKALTYKRMGVARMVVDESVYRDFTTLKAITTGFGDKVEIIANTICHRNCIYRNFHYNQIGGDSVEGSSKISTNFFEHICMLQRYENVSEILKLGWVRPEDLGYYTSIGINHFKLQGRQHVSRGGHLKALEYYFKGSYEGNLMELLDMFNTRYSFKVFIDNKKLDGFLKPYYENKSFCKNDCRECNYCESFSKKCIDHQKAEEVIKMAKDFYRKYDQYEELIDSVTIEESNFLKEDDMNFDFNLDQI